MARYKASVNFIHSVYIADGFADDCEELIYRCMQVSTLSYEKFCDVWKEMDFACIFHGRTLASELAELSEEVLHVAKHYMVANTSNFEESVAGLFLVYALLNLQPIPKFAALRIIPEDVPAIERIQTVARSTKRLDVLYILGHVLITGPCHYHAIQRERGMEFPIRKYLEGYTTIDHKGIRPKGVFYRQNEELDILRELTRVGKLYKEAKEKIAGPSSSDRDLKYVDDKFASELDFSLKNLISGIVEDQPTEEETRPEAVVADVGSKAQQIKDKAMKARVKPISHLTGIIGSQDESSPPSSPSPDENITPKGKSKQSTSKLPKKRTRKMKRGNSKKKRKPSTESDSSVEENFSFSSSDDDIEDTTPLINMIPQNTQTPETDPQRKYDFEIEIIDEYEGKDTSPLLPLSLEMPALNNDSPEDLTEIRDALQRRNVILTKVGNSSQCESTSRDVTGVAELTKVPSDDVFKKPYLKGMHSAIKERRDLKKPRIKTKFQRMGILPVANFIEENDQQK